MKPLLNYDLVNDVSNKLIHAGVGFGVFSGAYAALLTGHRRTNDIDIRFDYDQIDTLYRLFPEAEVKDRRKDEHPGPYDGAVFTLGEHRELQLMSGTRLYAAGGLYPFKWDEAMGSHAKRQTLGGLDTFYLDPVDTVVFKAILQRGTAQNKNDTQDILAIAEATSLNKEYLFWRIQRSHSHQRVIPFLMQLGVIEPSEVSDYTT